MSRIIATFLAVALSLTAIAPTQAQCVGGACFRPRQTTLTFDLGRLPSVGFHRAPIETSGVTYTSAPSAQYCFPASTATSGYSYSYYSAPTVLSESWVSSQAVATEYAGTSSVVVSAPVAPSKVAPASAPPATPTPATSEAGEVRALIVETNRAIQALGDVVVKSSADTQNRLKLIESRQAAQEEGLKGLGYRLKSVEVQTSTPTGATKPPVPAPAPEITIEVGPSVKIEPPAPATTELPRIEDAVAPPPPAAIAPVPPALPGDLPGLPPTS